MTVFPVYTGDRTSYWEGKSNNVDDRFLSTPIDPDLPLLYIEWVKHLGESLREQAKLDNWVRISAASSGGVPLGMEYIKMDPFWIEAITQSVNAYIEDQNKAQKEVMDAMNSKIEDMKPNQSLLAGAPRPSFNQY